MLPLHQNPHILSLHVVAQAVADATLAPLTASIDSQAVRPTPGPAR